MRPRLIAEAAVLDALRAPPRSGIVATIRTGPPVSIAIEAGLEREQQQFVDSTVSQANAAIERLALAAVARAMPIRA
jgi:hypothetical protein